MRSSLLTSTQLLVSTCIDFSIFCKENAIYYDSYKDTFNQLSDEPWPIATRDMLGDLQSDLKPSEYVIEFTSVKPKHYAYRVITNEGEKSVCNVTGITLYYHASKFVNFEVIMAMILV